MFFVITQRHMYLTILLQEKQLRKAIIYRNLCQKVNDNIHFILIIVILSKVPRVYYYAKSTVSDYE